MPAVKYDFLFKTVTTLQCTVAIEGVGGGPARPA